VIFTASQSISNVPVYISFNLYLAAKKLMKADVFL
jgi:hypothetical protein